MYTVSQKTGALDVSLFP